MPSPPHIPAADPLASSTGVHSTAPPLRKQPDPCCCAPSVCFRGRSHRDPRRSRRPPPRPAGKRTRGGGSAGEAGSPGLGRGGLGQPGRRPPPGGGNAWSDPPEVDRYQPHVAPPSPVSLTKATAAGAHHFASPNPSLKHRTTTTHVLSFVTPPPPGLQFGVAAATT